MAGVRVRIVLSVFPGIGLLDRAFEQEGFCIVRGPDVLWGGDIRCFHPPPGVFDGLIGGPPCQLFTILKRLVKNAGERQGNLIPEFTRVVNEARPRWFLMENVPGAPLPCPKGYIVTNLTLNNRWLGEPQERTRRFSFGSADGGHSLLVDVALFESLDYRQAVTSSLRRVPVALGGSGRVKRSLRADGKRPGPDQGPRASLAEMCVAQGLPATFLADSPFTLEGKRKAIGNGVPLPMGLAVARAVKRAMADA